MARVRQPGKTSKMMSTWMGPWRLPRRTSIRCRTLLQAKSHCPCRAPQFYKGSSLDVTEGFFQWLENQGEFLIEALLGVKSFPQGAYKIQVQQQEFSDSETSWKPLTMLYRDAPTYVTSQLASLRIPLTTRKLFFDAITSAFAQEHVRGCCRLLPPVLAIHRTECNNHRTFTLIVCFEFKGAVATNGCAHCLTCRHSCCQDCTGYLFRSVCFFACVFVQVCESV